MPTGRKDAQALRLTPIDAYVLSRIDGATSIGELALISGMAPEDLRPILERLVGEGAIEGPPAGSGATSPASTPRPAVDVASHDAAIQDAPPHDAASAEAAADGGAADDGAAAGPPEAAATHRQLFETRLHPLEEGEREALAGRAIEPELTALCFDPVPRVVRAVLGNPRAGLAQARLIAAHHGNAVGLDALGEKTAFLQDTEVQRLLLRNPQTPAPLLGRLLSRRRLAEVYQATQSRELPERNRRAAMEALRRRFSEASSEERVELILRTEGRVLVALAGLSLDGKAASLLCARPLTSLLLVENLARWPATPPVVIAHLLKQPMALRMPQVRTALKRHPNCPPSAR